ncbi:histone H2A deubiquitinase [Thalictrum thalictroides]|uniref:Histone H2A deubiquitinase n=1 Tax=Thalictrum thalictroides TaxID=46969 RepID=A0A7J6VCM0_THATH|nr:histone H2A deubiquitinase [Thalictrum thalictroides]
MYWEISNNNNSNTLGGGGGSGSGFNTSNPAPPSQLQLGLGLGKNPHHSISFQSSLGLAPAPAPGVILNGGGVTTNSSAEAAAQGPGGCGVGVGTSNRNRNKAPAVAVASSSSSLNNPLPLLGLNPDVELAVEWSPEEQAFLDDGLSKYAHEPNIFKYIKISATLPDKTVRDVALRCRWMTKKENGKRRKPEEYYAGKKTKDRKEKPEPSSKSSTPLAPPLDMDAYSLMMQNKDQNYRISCEVPGIGATTKHLLDENAQVFSHITANLATYKIQENVDLFGRTRRNILAIINDMRAMPGIMSQMPPLPVSVNEELANIVLPQSMTYCSPTSIYRKPDWRC